MRRMSLLTKTTIKANIDALKAKSHSHTTCSEVFELKKTMKLLIFSFEEMFNGSKNMDLMLVGQRLYLDKVSLSYIEMIRNRLETCLKGLKCVMFVLNMDILLKNASL